MQGRHLARGNWKREAGTGGSRVEAKNLPDHAKILHAIFRRTVEELIADRIIQARERALLAVDGVAAGAQVWARRRGQLFIVVVVCCVGYTRSFHVGRAPGLRGRWFTLIGHLAGGPLTVREQFDGGLLEDGDCGSS